MIEVLLKVSMSKLAVFIPKKSKLPVFDILIFSILMTFPLIKVHRLSHTYSRSFKLMNLKNSFYHKS